MNMDDHSHNFVLALSGVVEPGGELEDALFAADYWVAFSSWLTATAWFSEHVRSVEPHRPGRSDHLRSLR
jgi:hypothetical protein